MGITLFISEKPSLGRTVASAIGSIKDCKTHIVCKNDCVVAFAQGHLFELLMPEEYDQRFKRWQREDLPLDIPNLKLKVSESTKYRYDTIKDLLKKADRVIHVGDPDREGQRIVDDILEQAGWKGKVERLWNTDQSERGMKQTMEEFQKGFPDNSEPRFKNRSLAAKTRAEIDWRLGMNVSRAIGCRLNAAGIRKVVSYGRFQSTVLAIIVQRELERRNFKPKTYYGPKALIAGVETDFIDDPESFPDGYDSEQYLVNKSVAQKICDLVKGKEGTVVEFEKKKGAKSPPLPYDISRLIQDANRHYGISAKQTNEIAQSLYDKGITTYPRVDCRYLPDGHFQDASRILSALVGLAGADTANPKIKSKCFNSKKTDEAAHHAIVPTGDAWQKLSGKEMQVFQLIANAYIIQFHPDQEFETQKLIVRFDGPPKTEWKATGKKILKPGWTAVGGDDDEEEAPNVLPDFKKGDTVQCDSTKLIERETKKPAAFTEASIMAAMENVDRFEPNPEYKKLLREAKGIGTGATRGGILDLLQQREYITINKSVISPTKYGEDVISYIPEALKSPALTAIMEGQLEDIVQGRTSMDDVINETLSDIPKYLEMIDQVNVKADPKSGVTCPVCENAIAIRLKSKSGTYFWKCQNPDCGKFFPDNKGKLVAPSACPSCGANACVRIESKKRPGTYFWKCEKCEKFFGDDKGKIGRAFSETITAVCTKCGGEAKRFESRKSPGTFFWHCDACNMYFRDDNGSIGQANDNSDKPKDVCPICGGSAVKLISKKGNPFWKCEADSSHGPFSDDNGKPGQAFGTPAKSLADETCPHCKKEKAGKRESRNKPGVFYWSCPKCGNMADDNGTPGRLFSSK